MTSETGTPLSSETKAESVSPGSDDYRPSPLPVGATLGGNTIDRLLVASDSGFTYLANGGSAVVQEYFPQQIAVRDTDGISLLLADAEFNSDFDEGTTEFLAIARALSQIDHSGRVFEYQEKDGAAWYSVHMAARASVADLLATGQRLPEENVKAILYSAVTYLEAAHDAGALHLEIAPERILLAEEDQLLLCGFSTDKRHYPPEDPETKHDYRAPELASFRGQLGRWTDYYALGGVLYQAACKNAPAAAVKRLEAVDRGENDPYEPATQAGKGYFSPQTLALIDRLLALNPADRPQNASALINAVRSLEVLERSPKPQAPEVKPNGTATSPSPSRKTPVKPASRAASADESPITASKSVSTRPGRPLKDHVDTAKATAQSVLASLKQRLLRLKRVNQKATSAKKNESKLARTKASATRKEPVFDPSTQHIEDSSDIPRLHSKSPTAGYLANDLEDAGHALAGRKSTAPQQLKIPKISLGSIATLKTPLNKIVRSLPAIVTSAKSVLRHRRWRLALGVVIGLLVLFGLYLVITPPHATGTTSSPAKIEILGGSMISPEKPASMQIATSSFGPPEKTLSSEQGFSQQDDLARVNAYRDAERVARLSEPHLARAGELMATGSLISPPDANAYSEFSAVLRMNPENLVAQKGVEQIRSTLLEEIDLQIQALDFDAARDSLTKATRVFPSDPRLAASNERLLAAEAGHRDALRAIAEREKNQAQTAQRDRERRQKIELLLARALEALDKGRLVSPQGDNALTLYRAALDLDASNQRARNGLNNISAFYLQQTREALSVNDLDAAAQHLEIATSVTPESDDVVSLNQQLNRRVFLEAEKQRLQEQASSDMSLAQQMASEQDQLNLESGVKAYYAGDYRLAFQYLEPLAARSDPQAQVRVARMLMEARGVDRDKPRAISIFTAALGPVQLAASQGETWAQSDLADYYFDGLVIDKDYRTAAFWYQKAAEQGYAPAQTNLGWLYFNGYDGIAPNRAVAIYWFGEAASQGNQTAANNLRALGESVPSNTGG